MHTYAEDGIYTIRIGGSATNLGGTGAVPSYPEKIIRVESFGDIGLTNLTNAFNNAVNLTSLPTTLPASVNILQKAFANCRNLNSDLSDWDVSRVTNMNYTFLNCHAFTSDLSSWNVGSVILMTSLFKNARSFTSDLSNWNVANVTNMHSLFQGAELFDADLSTWDVSKVNNMFVMFSGTKQFQGRGLQHWDVGNVTNMGYMFYQAEAFNADLSNWDVSNVTSMLWMFREAPLFNSDLSSWDVSSVTNMSRMFLHAESFNQDLNNWDVSSVTDMGFMFQNASSFNGDVSGWDVRKVTTFQSMFVNAAAFNQDLGTWITGPSAIPTTMSQMFRNSTSFQGLGLENWDVSRVTNMSLMFIDTPVSSDLSTWNTANVTNMSSMFQDANLFNANVSTWDVSSVTNMQNMFNGASSFNGGDLSSWNTSQVTNMTNMFNKASSFNGDVSSWNTSQVTNMTNMFNNASSFNGDVSGWDVDQVTVISQMFGGASAFEGNGLETWQLTGISSLDYTFSGATALNADLSGWDVSNITSMMGTFSNASSFNADLSGWNVSNVTNMTDLFTGAISFNQNIGSWDVSNVSTFSSSDVIESSWFYAPDSIAAIQPEMVDSLLIGWSQRTLQNGAQLNLSGVTRTANSNSAVEVLEGAGLTIVDASIPRTPSPSITVLGGTYVGSVKVLINAAENATIYYTLDGTIPTVNDTEYTDDGIDLTYSANLNVIAIIDGFYPSTVVSESYVVIPILEQVRYNVPSGTYIDSVRVQITHNNPAASIHYTLDGSNPNANSSIFEGSLLIDKTTRIRAIAIADGYHDSITLDAQYTILPTLKSVDFLTAEGNYSDSVKVTLDHENQLVKIYYTLDESTPLDQYSLYVSPILLTNSSIIQAYAIADGYHQSPLTKSNYIITPTLPKANLSNYTGTYVDSVDITITHDIGNVNIYYSQDGSTPSMESSKYEKPIRIKETTTLKVISYANGYNASPIVEATYTILPTLETVDIFPNETFHYDSVLVELSHQRDNAQIYYTTDGSEPTNQSNLYSQPIKLEQSTLLKTLAFKDGFYRSPTVEKEFTIYPVLQRVHFNPGSGIYKDSVRIELSSNVDIANIYFTTDGSIPTKNSTRYTSPFTIKSSSTIRAISAANGYKSSQLSEANYIITQTPILQEVVFNPTPGTYADSVLVRLSHPQEGASIFFTTDGTEPTTESTPYEQPIMLTHSATFKALAVADGFNSSPIAQATYEITQTPTLLEVVFNPTPGTYADSVLVSLSHPQEGASIFFTTDGTEPTTESTPYEQPIMLTHSATFKALAVADGFNSSPIAQATYEITQTPTLLEVVFNPTPGTYADSVLVRLSHPQEGASIFFTTDGTEPTTESTPYEQPIMLTHSATFKALAVADGFNSSPIVQAIYEITQTPTLQEVVFNPTPGTYADSVLVSLSHPQEGASIFFTLDTSTPDQNSTRYSEAFWIKSDIQISVKVFKEGYNSSRTTMGSYFIENNNFISKNILDSNSEIIIDINETKNLILEWSVINSFNSRYKLVFYVDASQNEILYETDMLDNPRFILTTNELLNMVNSLTSKLNNAKSLLELLLHPKIEVYDNNIMIESLQTASIKITSPTITDLGDFIDIANNISLDQNYPNPFNPITQINFNLVRAAYTRLSVFNINGQLIVNIIDDNLVAGKHTVTFDATNLPSGVYIYKLTSDKSTITKKMTLLK